MARTHHIAGLLVPLLLVCGGAFADDAEVNQLREQLRSTVLQLRQLQDQQASAPQPQAAPPADDAAGKAKLGAAMARLRAARSRAGALQAELDKAKADNAALTAQSTQAAADMASLKAAYTQAADQARTLSADNYRLKDQLATMTRVATACHTKNDRLTTFAESLLTAYGKVGFGQALASKEPFLGLARVRLENIAQDREDTVRADRCDPRLDAAPPARAAGG